MPTIEPGERFKVGYGNGRSIEVKALSLRQKREVTKELQRVQQLQTAPESIGDVYEACENMLRICVPDMEDSLLDALDESMAMEVVGNTLGCAVLSEDDQKK